MILFDEDMTDDDLKWFKCQNEYKKKVGTHNFPIYGCVYGYPPCVDTKRVCPKNCEKYIEEIKE